MQLGRTSSPQQDQARRPLQLQAIHAQTSTFSCNAPTTPRSVSPPTQTSMVSSSKSGKVPFSTFPLLASSLPSWTFSRPRISPTLSRGRKHRPLTSTSVYIFSWKLWRIIVCRFVPCTAGYLLAITKPYQEWWSLKMGKVATFNSSVLWKFIWTSCADGVFPSFSLNVLFSYPPSTVILRGSNSKYGLPKSINTQSFMLTYQLNVCWWFL